MDIKGKKADLLQRADECARILGHPQHQASRFTNLTAGDRGIAVALQEYVEAQFAALRSEHSSFQHKLLTEGDAE